MINANDLTSERLEVLAKLIVDKWDLKTLVQFAEEQVFQDYQYSIEQAVRDTIDWDITLEDLNPQIN